MENVKALGATEEERRIFAAENRINHKPLSKNIITMVFSIEGRH